MKKLKLLVVVLCLLCVSPAMTLAASLEPKPLKVVDAVGPVMESKCYKVFDLTWGGDYAMTYGNGNAVRTAANSIFGKAGLCLDLTLEDNLEKQLSDYVTGKSPFARVTLGMQNMFADAVAFDPNLAPVAFILLTRSTGGDVLVVGPGIKTLADLKGKRIAVQINGPHMDFLVAALKLVGLMPKDVKIVWVKDITETMGPDTPAKAMLDGRADAAFVIFLDAQTLTTQGTVGTGTDGSVKGARKIFSSASLPFSIYDLIVVRKDFFTTHGPMLATFAEAIMKSQDEMDPIFKAKGPAWKAAVAAFATIILKSPQDVQAAGDMYYDCTAAGLAFNEKFFTDANYDRGYASVSAEIQAAFIDLGFMTGKQTMLHANWDYAALKRGGKLTYKKVEAPQYDSGKVAAVVSEMSRAGTLDERLLIDPIIVQFKPESAMFDSTLYAAKFDELLAKMSVAATGLIVIQGHGDPLLYLKCQKASVNPTYRAEFDAKMKQEGKSGIEAACISKNPGSAELAQIKQAVKNVSQARANAVRDAFIRYAATKNVMLSASQFQADGKGFEAPLTGMCGANPCPPKTEADWLQNMRVEFKVIQVEAEASTFEAL